MHFALLALAVFVAVVFALEGAYQTGRRVGAREGHAAGRVVGRRAALDSVVLVLESAALPPERGRVGVASPEAVRAAGAASAALLGVRKAIVRARDEVSS